MATHGGTQSVAGIVDIRRLSEQRESTLAPRGGRCTGSTGLAGSPRRPRIMEGPLVSDTTEILSGAPTASEDAPAAAGATASTSKSRSRGGTGLSSMLMPELQRIAQTLAIPGAGRMRKNQLIEAIEARQGGGPRQQTSVAGAHAGGSGGVVPPGQQGSDQRAASAGAGATRPQKQDAMQPDTHPRSGIGDSAQSGLGDAGRGGIGADSAGQQLS